MEGATFDLHLGKLWILVEFSIQPGTHTCEGLAKPSAVMPSQATRSKSGWSSPGCRPAARTSGDLLEPCGVEALRTLTEVSADWA